MKVRLERAKEHRIMQHGVHPRQFRRQRQQVRRQHRLRQRHLIAFRTKQDDLDPLPAEGFEGSSQVSAYLTVNHPVTFQVEVTA